MTKKKVKRIYIAAAAVLTALMIMMPIMSYALFTAKSDNKHPDIDAASFSVKTYYGFDNGGTVTYTESGGSGQLVAVELHDKTAANYVGKFRLKVKYEGSEGAMRVMVSNIWEQVVDGKPEVPRLLSIKFLYNTLQFVDNTRNDSHFYYCDKASFVDGSYNSYYYKGTQEFNIITGLAQETDSYEESVSLSLYIRAHIVQSNRWQEKWGISELPKPV